MKRLFAALLLFILIFTSAYAEHVEFPIFVQTPIEEVEFPDKSLFIGIIKIPGKYNTKKYYNVVLLLSKGQLVPVDTIPFDKIQDGYMFSEEYHEFLNNLKEIPLIEFLPEIKPGIVLLSAISTEGRFYAYYLKKDGSIIRFLTILEEFLKDGISIRNFKNLLNGEIKPSVEYTTNVSPDVVIFHNGISEGFMFGGYFINKNAPIDKSKKNESEEEKSEYYVWLYNSTVLGALPHMYELKIKNSK